MTKRDADNLAPPDRPAIADGPAPIIDAIFIAPRGGAALVERGQVRALAGSGLDGDRYAAGLGTFSHWRAAPDGGRHVTLIEAEAIDDVRVAHGVDLSAGRSRRNLVTRGLVMSELPTNPYLTIGDEVILRIDRTCPPCKYLERLLPGAMSALKGRGGLRASVMRGGWIRAGDAIGIHQRADVAERIAQAAAQPQTEVQAPASTADSPDLILEAPDDV